MLILKRFLHYKLCSFLYGVWTWLSWTCYFFKLACNCVEMMITFAFLIFCWITCFWSWFVSFFSFQSFAIFKFLPSVGAWSINSIVLYYCIGPRPSELYGKFTWRIDNFSQINRSELRSNSFDVGGYKWYCLFVCINWTHHLLFIFFLLPACFYYVVSGLLTCLLGVIWLLVFSDFTRNTSCLIFSTGSTICIIAYIIWTTNYESWPRIWQVIEQLRWK
jgi:hypothetical protein